MVATVSGVLVGHRQPELEQVRVGRTFEVPGTQVFRFQAVPYHAVSWGTARKWKPKARKLERRMARYQGGYQLKGPSTAIDPGHWGPKRTLAHTVHRLHANLGRAGPNTVWRMRPVSHVGYVWKTRKVDIDPAVKADTEGTDAIDIIVGSSLKHFSGLHVIGIYSCRYILGTTTLSQHAYGNAVDWGGTGATLTALAKWQYAMTKKGYLPISQLLWQGHDWFSGGYVYDHFDHLHDSGKPLLSGPCNRPDRSMEAEEG